jgi:hypothetical protein
MRKIAVVLFVVLFSSTMLYAQEYKTGLGVRGGFFSGFSVKHFMTQQDAIEGVVAWHYRGLLLTGMFQRHANAFDAPGLNWYYGGGGFLGFYDRRYVPWFSVGDRGAFTTFGILGVVGLEYKIEEIPVAIGFDITPAFNIIGHTGLWPGAGITLRYTIE